MGSAVCILGSLSLRSILNLLNPTPSVQTLDFKVSTDLE